ncbi:MAG: GDSL-type esterase/lipase family protein [Myxococcota bacterium]
MQWATPEGDLDRGRPCDGVSSTRVSKAKGTRRLAGFVLNVGLALVSVTLTLAALEIALRFAGYEAIHSTYSKPSMFWKADRLLGWSHQSNAVGTFVGPRPWPIEFRADVAINSDGLRGPEIGPRPERGYRVLLLGDSVVAGFEVPYEETFAALLESELSKRVGAPVQVINAGVRGYGTDQSYLFYRERGIRFDPDLVMLLHSDNDTRNNMTLHRSRRVFSKPALVLHEDERLELVRPPDDTDVCAQLQTTAEATVVRADSASTRAACKLQMALFDHSALFSVLTTRLRESPDLLRSLYRLGAPKRTATEVAASQPATSSYPSRLTSAIIAELAQTVGSTSAGFVLFGSPRGVAMIDEVRLASEGVFAHAIAPDGEDHRFVRDGHYNTEGHRVAAERFTPILAKRLLEVAVARAERRATLSAITTASL